jgi:hypothetical protein
MAISKSIKKRNKTSADMFKLAKGLKKGGSAKKKSKFPDHSGDGKITKKDILMAKGIIPKKKKMKKEAK